MRHAPGHFVPVRRRSARPLYGCGAAEPLEPRTLLSGVTVGVTPGSSGAGQTLATLTDTDGGGVLVRHYGTALRVNHAAASAMAAAPSTGGFNLVLNKGPNLTADPVASAAFEQAAAFFESVFHDPITVVIDAEVAPLGPQQLGVTDSVIFGDTFDTIRNAIASDASGGDEAFVAGLPGAGAFQATLPDGSYSVDGILATRANLLALGVDPAELPGPFSEYADAGPTAVRRDAKITFSSDYAFDYDRSDGISPGKSDFVGVAVHEIGHALGFVSIVDQIDGGGPHAVSPMPLDLFRFAPGAGGADFAGGTRVLSPGNVVPDQVFYDGGVFDPSAIHTIGGLARGDVPMSTGAFNGDGNQTSHWKDESMLGGVAYTIGIMDPVATVGTQVTWTAADQRAFSLIGYDADPPAPPTGISGTVYEDVNGNGRFDAATESGLAGVTVYDDANNNGQFDSGVAERFAPAVDLPRDIPDAGPAVQSRIVIDDLPGTVRDVNVTVTIQHPYTFDISATLVSPSGRSVNLFHDVGEEDFIGQSIDFTNTVLDDEAGESILQGAPPFTGAYRPLEPLSAMDGEAMNGTWTLVVRDQYPFDEGTLIDWGLTFDTGEGERHATSDFDGSYSFPDATPGTYRLRQVLPDGYHQTEPAGGAARVIDLAEGQEVTGQDFGSAQGVPPSAVVNRQVFYNNSLFDGRNPAANADDDGAIATDKQALLPGQAASAANVTNYSRGINGVMVDVANLPAGATPTLDDFDFRVGTAGDPTAWDRPASIPQISLRRGAGVNGSDRITFTIRDGGVVRKWLQVTVKPTANTGLAQPDVFYFGNLIGDTGSGNSASAVRVTAADVVAVRAALNKSDRPVTDATDFNRDGRVNASDYAIARNGVGASLSLLTAASVQSAPAVFGEARIAARRTAYRPATSLVA
jgi:subtilisin-like proprotein convertase family protein